MEDRTLEIGQTMVPSVRRLVPQLVVAGVLPVVGYALLRPHVGSDATALAAVMVFPLAEVLVERRRAGHVEPIGVIAMIGIGLGVLGAVALHGNATLLKVRESAVTGVFGLICVASLTARRPVMFFLARSFATGNDREAMAEFDEIWELPGVPRRFRFVTAMWGVVLVAEAVFRTVLALTVSTERFLAISPVVGWVVIGGMIWFTRAFIRCGEQQVRAALPAD